VELTHSDIEGMTDEELMDAFRLMMWVSGKTDSVKQLKDYFAYVNRVSSRDDLITCIKSDFNRIMSNKV
jgi:hypothetical protein